MRSLHRLFALLTLLGWLTAIGHLVLEDGGVAEGGAYHAESGGGHESGHDGELHHHDLTVMAGRLGAKTSVLPALAPAAFARSLTALLAAPPAPRCFPAPAPAPTDRRTAGWLHVCRTALPVRGPAV